MKALIKQFTQWQRLSGLSRELQMLSDATLRDIGIARDCRQVPKPFWMA